jgi:hypothetical protein
LYRYGNGRELVKKSLVGRGSCPCCRAVLRDLGEGDSDDEDDFYDEDDYDDESESGGVLDRGVEVESSVEEESQVDNASRNATFGQEPPIEEGLSAQQRRLIAIWRARWALIRAEPWRAEVRNREGFDYEDEDWEEEEWEEEDEDDEDDEDDHDEDYDTQTPPVVYGPRPPARVVDATPVCRQSPSDERGESSASDTVFDNFGHLAIGRRAARADTGQSSTGTSGGFGCHCGVCMTVRVSAGDAGDTI